VEALRPEALAAPLELARNNKELFTALLAACDAESTFDADGYTRARSLEAESAAHFVRVTGAALHSQIEVVPAKAEAFIRAGEDVLRAAQIDPYPSDGALRVLRASTRRERS
jgi:hypothetical protein